MEFLPLSRKHLKQALRLFSSCFFHNPYYEGMYPTRETMELDLTECFDWILQNGECHGALEENKLIGMTLTFPVSKLNSHMFDRFFGNEGVLCDLVKQHLNSVYLYAICVDESFRGQGIASKLFDQSIHPHVSYLGDVANDISLSMCKKRGFQVKSFENPKFPWFQVCK